MGNILTSMKSRTPSATCSTAARHLAEASDEQKQQLADVMAKEDHENLATSSESSLIRGLPDDLTIQCLARIPRAHHASLRLVCASWRSVTDSSELYEARRLAGADEESFYVLTLFPILKSFDPRTARWRILPPMPGVMESDLLIDCSRVVVGRKLFIIGGLHVETSELKMTVRCEVLMYNAATGQWEEGAPMSTPRRNFACGVIGGQVYVAGGHNLTDGFLNSAEVYSIADDSWHSLDPLSPKHGPSIGAVINGEFCVLENCEEGSSSVEVLNGKEWVTIGDIVPANPQVASVLRPENFAQCQRPLHGATVLGGKLYVISQDRTSVRVFCSVLQSWNVIEMPPLPDELSYTIHGIAGFKGELYVIGLKSAKERSFGIHPMRTIHAYKPAAKNRESSWRNIVCIEYTRRFHIGYVGFAIISV